jgi:hypothetical protein
MRCEDRMYSNGESVKSDSENPILRPVGRLKKREIPAKGHDDNSLIFAKSRPITGAAMMNSLLFCPGFARS